MDREQRVIILPAKEKSVSPRWRNSLNGWTNGEKRRVSRSELQTTTVDPLSPRRWGTTPRPQSVRGTR